jgi:hypothetical protein
MYFAALTLRSRAFGSTHNTHTVMLFKTTYSMHGGGDFWLFWAVGIARPRYNISVLWRRMHHM